MKNAIRLSPLLGGYCIFLLACAGRQELQLQPRLPAYPDFRAGIEGLDIYLRAYGDVEFGETTLGFQHRVYAASVVVEVFHQSLAEINRSGLNDENLKRNNFTLKRSVPVRYGDKAGWWFEWEQPEGNFIFRKYVLMIEMMPDKTIMVRGTVPTDEKAVAVKTRKNLANAEKLERVQEQVKRMVQSLYVQVVADQKLPAD